MRQRVSGFLRQSGRSAAAEHVGELAERREQVDDPEAGHRATDEIVREQRAEDRQRLDEVIAVPERRPGNQDQQQPGFEQQRDEQQTSEQGNLPFGLHFRQAIYPACDIAIAAGFGFELDEDGQCPGLLARLLEGLR